MKATREFQGTGYQRALTEIKRLAGVARPALRIGRACSGKGAARGHFGEIYQGALACASAPGGRDHEFRASFPATARYLDDAPGPRLLPHAAVRCLVDLPCEVLKSQASVQLSPSHGLAIHLGARAGPKCARALQLLLDLIGIETVGARIDIDSNIPIGKGCGSSSADVHATLAAACLALKVQLSAPAPGLLLCLAEGASNAVHSRLPILFAHRRGLELRLLGPAWPRFHILGFDPGGVVITDSFEPLRYSGADLRRHSVAIEALHAAVRSADPAATARVSTQIARCDERLAHDHQQLDQWVREFGALGYAVSHSGVVAALLWARNPGSLEPRARARRLLDAGGFRTWSWSV